MNACDRIPTPPAAQPRARGFTAAQLGALGELCKTSPRVELELELRGGLDGAAIATVRDRWAVEHYRINPDGVITRPALTSRTPGASKA